MKKELNAKKQISCFKCGNKDNLHAVGYGNDDILYECEECLLRNDDSHVRTASIIGG